VSGYAAELSLFPTYKLTPLCPRRLITR